MPRLNSKLTHVVKYLKGNHKMTYIYINIQSMN